METTGNGTRKDLERQWRAQLDQARERYDFAVTQCRKTLQEHQHRLLPPPDGSAAVRLSLRLESDTRAEYMRILRIFTDLIVNGKTPETQ